MKYVKYILKNIHLLNIALIIAIIFIIHHVVLPVLNMSTKISVLPDKNVSIEEGKKQTAWQIPSFSDFIIIADQNLFSPARSILSAEEAVQEEPPPQVTLYGTLITDDLRVAYIENQKDIRSTPGRGKRQLRVEKGYRLGGYTISEIENDHIILVKGEQKIVVSIDDIKKRDIGKVTKTAELPASKALPKISARTRRPFPQPNAPVGGAVSNRAITPDLISPSPNLKMPETTNQNLPSP